MLNCTYISFFLSVNKAVVNVSLGKSNMGNRWIRCTKSFASFLLYPTSLAYKRALKSSVSTCWCSVGVRSTDGIDDNIVIEATVFDFV